jgi:hypothetical protein
VPDDVDVGGLSFRAARVIDLGTPAYFVTAGDLDDDRDIDLAVVGIEATFEATSSPVAVLLNDGTGSFAAPLVYSLAHRAFDLTAGDFDGDQDLDLVVAGREDPEDPRGSLSVLFNEGPGTFAAAVNYPQPGWILGSIAGDLDGDLDLDLAVRFEGLSGVSVLLNDGGGGFPTRVDHAAGTDPATGITRITGGDLDGDQDFDLAVANDTEISVLLQEGGSLAPAVNYPVLAGGVGNLTVADLDGDLDLDLAAAGSSHVWVLLNGGGGTFALAATYGANIVANTTQADLDGDLDLDLVLAGNLSTVEVLVNEGGGAFHGALSFGAGRSPSSLASGDLDGDQDLDLVEANYWTDEVSVLRNEGDGTFSAPVMYSAGDSPISVAAEDFDGDQDLDLAVLSLRSANVTVRLNRGGGNFGPPVHYGVA